MADGQCRIPEDMAAVEASATKRNMTFTVLLCLLAVAAPAARAAEALPAFPGAEGFGAESVVFFCPIIRPIVIRS